ncbi:MAG: cytochrome c biogenesis protein CcdA [Candidatus Thermoplasmatota archaeon]|nr:cytochrome c biogenesis protein CcdA [Candidatus Thermoplasmatota archaeon]MEE3201013.1 cytochrome c biogenesis protein CcdA [Candidatus Thermoplasmatota archaeon]MEE3303881.1 cytochrome c biogenesis protein CcdA [Candidatus Thermoplasmatota archaeon]
MQAGLDLGVLKELDTWKAFGIGVVLFCIIGYASLSLFGLTSSIYGTSNDVTEVPDWVAPSMNREGIDDLYAAEDGTIQLSSLRGNVVILDFMAIDCANCHYVQEHIDQNLAAWEDLEGSYPVITVSIATWYQVDSFEQINSTFGDPESDRHMSWPIVNGGNDVVILEDGEEDGMRGDIVEYYSAQAIPLALVIDHEGFAVAKENTGTPLDGWKAFDDAIEAANLGEAEDLRIGIQKSDRSFSGVFIIGLFLGVLVYFSPCAFPVLPSYITYYLSLGMREDELRQSGKLSGKIPNSFEVGGFAALGQLTFFGIVGIIIFGLSEVINLSGVLHKVAIAIAWLLLILGGLMLLGWTSHLLTGVQRILDKYQTRETDEIFTPRRNMYLWGIGYSAASVDCTAAAVFPFVAWLTVVGKGAFVAGLGGLILSVTMLMILVTGLVGMGRQAMIGFLRRSTGIVKSTGAWMMMFAGIGLLIYLTQPETVAGLL